MPAASVTTSELPEGALLRECRRRGEWTDCYVTQLNRRVTHAEFVEAFYTTWLFKIERWILTWAISRPSTDQQAHELAAGRLNQFAAWTVEQRAPNQILLTAADGRTRSWLMIAPGVTHPDVTQLYFGSAIVPRPSNGQSASIPRKPAGLFGLLLGFHDLYSRALLSVARQRMG